jgi:hypothetical protein
VHEYCTADRLVNFAASRHRATSARRTALRRSPPNEQPQQSCRRRYRRESEVEAFLRQNAAISTGSRSATGSDEEKAERGYLRMTVPTVGCARPRPHLAAPH